MADDYNNQTAIQRRLEIERLKKLEAAKLKLAQEEFVPAQPPTEVAGVN